MNTVEWLTLGLALCGALCVGVLAWAWRQVQQLRRAQLQLLESFDQRLADPRGQFPVLQASDPRWADWADAMQRALDQRNSALDEARQEHAEALERSRIDHARWLALLSRWPEAVVVCNAQAMVLLYNQMAQQWAKDTHDAQHTAVGGRSASGLGLGRSIMGLLERSAFEQAEQQLKAQIEAGVAMPQSSWLMTTEQGELTQVHLAPLALHPQASAPLAQGFMLRLVQSGRAESQALEVAEADDAAPWVAMQMRPLFLDADLFHQPLTHQFSDDTPLDQIVFTVFDTETTGLRPSEGDEILQIGAVRVVGGKLVGAEVFDQLVNPGRRIPEAGIPIHGITEAMVKDQPRLEQVLPSFHAFVGDSVLVAHNAAFDMRFLQLGQRRVGLKFDHPVLDTLLLSSLIHPNQSSHRLDALAERMGIEVIGRHTALGDAWVTAQVWTRMLPVLAQRGIRTLGQAREACAASPLANLEY